MHNQSAEGLIHGLPTGSAKGGRSLRPWTTRGSGFVVSPNAEPNTEVGMMV